MSLLDKASLIVTPNAYKTSKLYSVVPNTTLGDMDVVRGTTATRVNSAGLIESVGVNIPRIDYTNASCPSILVEPQRTNVVNYSEQFDDASWVKLDITISQNSTTSPNGTINADKINETGINSFFITGASGTLSSSTQYTFTFYAKAAERSIARVLLGSANFNENYAYFNLSTGITTTTAQSSSMQDVGNGWYRCTITDTTKILPTAGVVVYLGASNNMTNGYGTYTGTLGSGIYVWGAQLEAGSYATSYIPTVATSVTRNADVISKTGISSLIGQTEGVMYLDFVCRNNSTFQILSQIQNASGPNAKIDLRWADGGLYSLGNNNGSNQFYLSVGSVSVGSRYKIAIAYKNNDVVVYKNGVQVATDTSCTFIDQSMSSFSYAENLNTYIEAMSVNTSLLFKTRLTNTELATLTTI